MKTENATNFNQTGPKMCFALRSKCEGKVRLLKGRKIKIEVGCF